MGTAMSMIGLPSTLLSRTVLSEYGRSLGSAKAAWK
jgi:hypothetical protein